MNKEQLGEKLKAFFTRLGRRNLIIISCVMLVAIAVGVNCIVLAGRNTEVDVGATGEGGDSEGANASGDDMVDSYFAASQLSRQKARDEALEVLKSVVEDDAVDDEAKAVALADIARMAKDMENEANVESLVMSKGFERCVAVISGSGISLVVDTSDEPLNAAQIAQINTIVYEQTGITPDKTVIIEK